MGVERNFNIKINNQELKKYLKYIDLDVLDEKNNFLKFYYKTILNESFEILYPIVNFINVLLTKKEIIIENSNNNNNFKKKLINLITLISEKLKNENIIIKNINTKSLEIKDNINKKYFVLDININNKELFYLKKFLQKIKNNNIKLNNLYEVIEQINSNEKFLKIKNKYQKVEFYLNIKLKELKINNIANFAKLEYDNILFENEYILLKFIDLELLMKEYKNFYNIFLYQETEKNIDILELLLQISSLIVDEKFYLNKTFVNNNLYYKLKLTNNIKNTIKIKQVANKNKE